MFKLEVLKAKHGDCLMLHYGDEAHPRHILIDGGPRGVYRKHLKPRLRALQNGDNKPVKLDLVMVSHIDADHIRGVIDLTRELATAIEDNSPDRIADIRELWHNSFKDFTPDTEPASSTDDNAKLSPAEADAEDLADISEPDIDLVLEDHTKLALASVKQGRELRHLAEKLAIKINPKAANGLVLSGHEKPFGDLTLKVIGPKQAEVDDLKKKWDKEVKKLLEDERKEKKMKAAAYLDRSVANLSSLIVVAELGGKRMLLTGDARGNHIIESLEAHELFDKNGVAHFDVLKLPHHGSDRNVEDDFFRRVTADHYVISGDGFHCNPELETYRMLIAARDDNKRFTLHMTYPPEDLRGDYPSDDLEDLLDEAMDQNPKIVVKYPEEGQHSMMVDLSN